MSADDVGRGRRGQVAQALEVRDLHPGFGAEIVGLDPVQALDEKAAALLRQTFDERGILVFRDLDIDSSYQAMLAKTVVGGGVDTADGKEADAADAIFVSNAQADGNAPYGMLLFHSDMMWHERPFDVLTLYGLEVEQPAVPTVFTSAANSWDTLPDDLRARVANRSAVHATGQRRRGDDGSTLLQAVRENVMSTTKPVAYPHPRTGRTLLYVCQMMTERIEGLDGDESEALLAALFDHLYSDASTWTHEWRNGDLVMWDNLATQHMRPNVSLDGPVRTLRKVIAPKPNLRIEKPKYER
jgi:taurine dioxygenase